MVGASTVSSASFPAVLGAITGFHNIPGARYTCVLSIRRAQPPEDMTARTSRVQFIVRKAFSPSIRTHHLSKHVGHAGRQDLHFKTDRTNQQRSVHFSNSTSSLHQIEKWSIKTRAARIPVVDDQRAGFECTSRWKHARHAASQRPPNKKHATRTTTTRLCLLPSPRASPECDPSSPDVDLTQSAPATTPPPPPPPPTSSAPPPLPPLPPVPTLADLPQIPSHSHHSEAIFRPTTPSRLARNSSEKSIRSAPAPRHRVRGMEAVLSFFSAVPRSTRPRLPLRPLQHPRSLKRSFAPEVF